MGLLRGLTLSSVTFILTYIFHCPLLKNIRFKGVGGGAECACYMKKNKSSMEFAVLIVVRMKGYLPEYMTTHARSRQD
jgi:hypothetical protein